VKKLGGYYYMAAAVFLYFLSGSDGSLVHKQIHRVLHPYDEPPPTFYFCTGRPQPRHKRSRHKRPGLTVWGAKKTAEHLF